MKSLVSITTLSLLLAGQAMASSQFDHLSNYGIVISHSGASAESAYEPTGHIVGVMDSSDAYGNVLYDLDRKSPQAESSTQPSIGDAAYDYGNILYDTGSTY